MKLFETVDSLTISNQNLGPKRWYRLDDSTSTSE